MAKAEAPAARPLSPHLTIFRPYVNMMMSIAHRITGVVNYFGTILITTWLVAAAAGAESFQRLSEVAGSPVGLFLLFGLTWSLVHHALGGIRHFIWDTGRGFGIPTVRALSWATILGSMSLTALIWFIGLSRWGAL